MATIVDVARLQANTAAGQRADPVCFLKAEQTAQENGFYSANLLSFLNDAQDWKLVMVT